MEVKDKVVTAEGLKGAYDNLNGKITQLNSDLGEFLIVRLLTMESVTISGNSTSISHGTPKAIDGYTPMFICGFKSGSINLMPYLCRIESDGTVVMHLRNIGSNSYSGTPSVIVAYIKNIS